MLNKKRLAVLIVVVVFILLIPLIAMQFIDEVNWNFSDFLIAVVALFGASLTYELTARRSNKTMYRSAFAIGLLGALLLFWVNGAVGIIGSENNSVNLMYGAVFAVVLIGSLLVRFKPQGMACTLFAAALVQLLVPVFASLVWPTQISWGTAGIIGVFVFNSVFAVIFIVSGLLFHRIGKINP